MERALRPVVAMRRKKSSGSDLDDLHPVVNTALTAIITAERYLPVKQPRRPPRHWRTRAADAGTLDASEAVAVTDGAVGTGSVGAAVMAAGAGVDASGS